MELNEKIQKLIEQRQTEAAAKNLTKKLMAIIFALGEDMIDQSGSLSGVDGYSVSRESTLSWLYEDTIEQEELPTSYDSPTAIGKHFDGLTSGVNLQIRHQDEIGFVQAIYNGIVVYREQQGKLERYVPSIDWESKLDELYEIAKKKMVRLKAEPESDDSKNRRESQTNSLMEYLRKFWGITTLGSK